MESDNVMGWIQEEQQRRANEEIHYINEKIRYKNEEKRYYEEVIRETRKRIDQSNRELEKLAEKSSRRAAKSRKRGRKNAELFAKRVKNILSEDMSIAGQSYNDGANPVVKIDTGYHGVKLDLMELDVSRFQWNSYLVVYKSADFGGDGDYRTGVKLAEMEGRLTRESLRSVLFDAISHHLIP